MFKIFLTTIFVFSGLNLANAQEACRYINRAGKMKIVSSKRDVPRRYRDEAECIDTANLARQGYLAKPEELNLVGNIRRENMSTPLGPLELRWPRNIEGLFGRTPNRAVQEAARAISRVLRQAAFPTELQRNDIDWKVVFLDTREPDTQRQIPAYLVHNCHPGWMTPPANIYIVAQRVAGDCSIDKHDSASSKTSGVADAELAEVLVHEFSHAVEYQILGGARIAHDRIRAEGFATWLEHYTANQSPILNAREMERKRMARAKYSYKITPTNFTFSRGDGADYARASMYFSAIENRFGVRGVVDVYETIKDENLPLFQAIQKRLNWDKQQLEDEVTRILQ